jgi:hypothetical protein
VRGYTNHPHYPPGFAGTPYDGDVAECDPVVRVYGNHPCNVVKAGSTQFEVDCDGDLIASSVFFTTNIAMGASLYRATGNELRRVREWLAMPEGLAFLKSRGVV